MKKVEKEFEQALPAQMGSSEFVQTLPAQLEVPKSLEEYCSYMKQDLAKGTVGARNKRGE